MLEFLRGSPNGDYVSYSSAYFVNPDGNVNFSIHYVGLDSYGIKIKIGILIEYT